MQENSLYKGEIHDHLSMYKISMGKSIFDAGYAHWRQCCEYMKTLFLFTFLYFRQEKNK
jgi:hypothetical protein